MSEKEKSKAAEAPPCVGRSSDRKGLFPEIRAKVFYRTENERGATNRIIFGLLACHFVVRQKYSKVSVPGGHYNNDGFSMTWSLRRTKIDWVAFL